MKGHCLCRSVSVEVAEAPAYINICNCDFCRRLGAAWGYYKAADVSVEGVTSTYRRDDIDDVWLDAHFCPGCGSCTHYAVIREGHDGVAINTRLVDQQELHGIEVRYLDGKAVNSDEDEFARTAMGTIGDGHSF